MKLSPFGIIAFIVGAWTLLILGAWYYAKTPEKKHDVTDAVTPPAVQEQQAPASAPPSAKVVGPMSDALMEEAIRVLIGQPGDPIAKAAMKVLSRDKAALRRVASETTVAGRTRALCDTLEA